MNAKKKTPCYQEQDEDKRALYREAIARFSKDQRIYLDESGLCHKIQRTHGYAKQGERVHGRITGKRKKRTNIIGAWSNQNKLFATQTYEHTVNKSVFVNWIKQRLLPHLKKGMVVIMDNAPWHKGDDIQAMIENTGAKMVKLPPYSPDLNPIEHAWANLKARLKTAKHYLVSFEENLMLQLKNVNYSSLS